MTPRILPLALGWTLVAGTATHPCSGQTPYLFESEDSGAVVGAEGSALIVEAPGAWMTLLSPVNRTRSLRTRWVMVQDTSLGVVFSEPSGIKSGSGDFDGDIDVRTLRSLRAVEFTWVGLDLWGELEGMRSFTSVELMPAGAVTSFDPRWRDLPGPANEHRTSILWVSRLILDDESIVVADPAPAREALRILFPGIDADSVIASGPGNRPDHR